MRQLTRLVLASGSPRRVELLGALGLHFDSIASQVDETTDGAGDPSRLVVSLALAKARAVSQSLEPDAAGALVLGADTVVVLDGDILGKPASAAQARLMLSRLSARCHEVYTGVATVRCPEMDEASGFRVTKVFFRPIAAAEIDAYIATGEPEDKAGAYALQGAGAAFVERLEGCYTNVIGLPLPLAIDLIRRGGVPVLGLA